MCKKNESFIEEATEENMLLMVLKSANNAPKWKIKVGQFKKMLATDQRGIYMLMMLENTDNGLNRKIWKEICFIVFKNVTMGQNKE